MKQYERPTAVMCKTVPGFEDYLIYEDGRVYSVKSQKFLKPVYGREHLRVSLCDKGRPIKVYVHRLVAEAFIENPDNLEVVHHKDGDPKNNNVSNLMWISNSEHTAMHKPRSKRVRDVDTGEIYESARAASIALGRSLCKVAHNIRRGYRTKGHRFEFIN